MERKVVRKALNHAAQLTIFNTLWYKVPLWYILLWIYVATYSQQIQLVTCPPSSKGMLLATTTFVVVCHANLVEL